MLRSFSLPLTCKNQVYLNSTNSCLLLLYHAVKIKSDSVLLHTRVIAERREAFLPSQNIGQYLQKIRKSKQMTQSEVAKQLNVSPQAVSKWECNDSLPDIALLPEIAKLYNIGIDDILNPKDSDEALNHMSYQQIISEMNAMIDNHVFQKLLEEFAAAESVKDLAVPLEIFIFLNNQQKEQLFTLLFEIKDYEIILADLIPYTNLTQRTLILKQLLNEHQFSFLEEMLPFLNREHKDMMIQYAVENHLEYDIIENYIVFFDSKQRETIQRWYKEKI